MDLTDDRRPRPTASVRLDGPETAFTPGGGGAESGSASDALGVLDEYRILRRIGQGGQGVVYEAEDTQLRRRVAVKTLSEAHAFSEKAMSRFRREAQLTARIEHPNICSVLRILERESYLFVVMPFIEGEPLSQRLRSAAAHLVVNPRNPGQIEDASRAWGAVVAKQTPSPAGHGALTPAESPGESRPVSSSAVDSSTAQGAGESAGDLRRVLLLVEKVARAVHAAHEAGIVHRDLKPANVMIRHDAEPVVLDLGLAIDLTDPEGRITDTGFRVGTPLYMAPEQYLVDGAIGPPTDVYALGLILYEFLTFRMAFTGDALEIQRRKRDGDYAPPERVNPRIPRDLAAVCAKALQPDPVKRYATAVAFAEDLRRVRLLEPTVARPAGPGEKLARQVRRHRAGIAIGAVLLTAAGISLYSKFRVDEVKDYLGAVSRILEAKSKGLDPAESDRAELERILPDVKSRETFLRHAPAEADQLVALRTVVESMRERVRSAGAGAAELHAPRAGIDTTRPGFFFEWAAGSAGAAPPAAGEFEVRLANVADSSEGPVGPVADVAGRPGWYVAELPKRQELTAGVPYQWSVWKRGSPRAVLVGSARFRAVTSAEREGALSRLAPTGVKALDAALRASALLSLDMAGEADAVLADALDSAPPPLRRALLALQAECRVRLGRAEGAERVLGELSKSP